MSKTSQEIKFTPYQLKTIAVLYIMGGKRDILLRLHISHLSEEYLGGRNVFSFLKESKYGLSQGRNFYRLPIEYAQKEILEWERRKNNGRIIEAFCPQTPLKISGDKGINYFLDEFSKIKNPTQNPKEPGEYFYGTESVVPNGPDQTKHYLKMGKAKTWAGVRTQFNKRVIYDGFYEGSTLRGKWAIKLKPGISGKIAEVLFNEAFGVHCTRLNEDQRYLSEYFRYGDREIQEIISKLEIHQHPCPEWTKGKTPPERYWDESII